MPKYGKYSGKFNFKIKKGTRIRKIRILSQVNNIILRYRDLQVERKLATGVWVAKVLAQEGAAAVKGIAAS